jgi:hypothetical protein
MQKMKSEQDMEPSTKTGDQFWQTEATISNVKDDFAGIFDRGSNATPLLNEDTGGDVFYRKVFIFLGF